MKISVVAVGLLGLIHVGPAGAASFVFDFTVDLGSPDLSDPARLSEDFDDVTGDMTLTATAAAIGFDDTVAQLPDIQLRNFPDGLGVNSGFFQLTGVSNTTTTQATKSLIFSFLEPVRLLSMEIDQRSLNFADDYFHLLYGSNDDGILACGGAPCFGALGTTLLAGSTTDTGPVTLLPDGDGYFRHLVASVPLRTEGAGLYLVRGLTVATRADAPPGVIPLPAAGGLLAGGLALFWAAAGWRRRREV
ncbi:MAG: hypothetical protein ACXIU8_11920 [Alkalilacustris sp.]